jgi:hypothetical protein
MPNTGLAEEELVVSLPRGPHEETGAHVVQLRALGLSDRWDDGMRLALKELHAPVRLVS